MLAAASAQAQGKTLAEVCTVYGVATVALEAEGSQTPQPAGHGGEIGGQPCTLAALSSIAANDANAGFAPQSVGVEAVATRQREPALFDACDRWLSRQHHGPPSLA